MAHPFKRNLANKEGYVYIARCDTGHIKIGRSKSPNKRIKHFDTIMPVSVSLMSWFYADNYLAAESLLHRQLDTYREKGEWFKLPPEMIKELLSIFCYIDGDFCTIDTIKEMYTNQAQRR